MKRKLLIAIVLFIVYGQAAANMSEAKNINTMSVEVDSEQILTDILHVRQQGVTFVPLRPIVEAIGAQLEWNGKARTITITKDTAVVELKMNHNQIIVDGVEHELPHVARVVEGSTVVPYYFFQISLGITTEWLPDERRLVLVNKTSKISLSGGSFLEMPHPLLSRDGHIMVPAYGTVSYLWGRIINEKQPPIDHEGKMEILVDSILYLHVSLQDGSNIMVSNGIDIHMPVAAFKLNNDIYIPLDILAGLLDYKVTGATNLEAITFADMSDFYRTWDLSELRYEGNLQNGKAHGKGKVFYNELHWYEGDFVDGVIQGQGEFYRNGYLYYAGGVRGGVPHGQGAVCITNVTYSTIPMRGTFIDGNMEGYFKIYDGSDALIFEGQFSGNKENGPGKEYEQGKMIFDGQYKKGLRNGYGTEFDYNGEPKYSGNYVDGQYHGEGTVTYRLGYQYKGRFAKGLPTGEGELRKRDKDRSYSEVGEDIAILPYQDQYVYIGQVKDGLADGQGRVFEASTSGWYIYEGSFEQGMYHGKGTYYQGANQYTWGQYRGTFVNGDLPQGKRYYREALVYDGQFKNMMPHGQGTQYDYLYEEEYRGYFVEGKKQGEGVHYDSQGDILFEGIFHQNEYYVGRTFKGNGTVLYEGTFDESKRLEGTVHYGNGQRYEGRIQEGEFIDGNLYDGRNRIIHSGMKEFADDYGYDGSVFYGTLVRNFGNGTLHMADGTTFTGKYDIEGNGTMNRQDGQVMYEGDISYRRYHSRIALPHGQGKVYSTSGKLIADGTLVNGYVENLNALGQPISSSDLSELEASLVAQVDDARIVHILLTIQKEAYYQKFIELPVSLRAQLIGQYMKKHNLLQAEGNTSVRILYQEDPIHVIIIEEDLDVYVNVFPYSWMY